MKRTTIDVADMKISNDEEEILIAPSLGSCIAISVYDPVINAGGLIIFMLPNVSEIDVPRVREQIYMFADTGVPAFFMAAEKFGLSTNSLKIVIAGGGRILGQQGDSDLGSRNYESALQLISSMGFEPTHKSVGGYLNRTLELNIKTGVSTITVVGDGIEEI